MPPGTEKRETLVLDTSAFIAGFEPLAVQNILYSVPEVESELAENSLPKTRFAFAVENGKLIVETPKLEYLKKVKKLSKAGGDLRFLSKADQQVLALALQLKDLGFEIRVVTDDYSMQNVASQNGVKFVPLITFGIRYRFQWTIYCPACRRKYPGDHEANRCEICGTELKRKPIGKTLI